MDEGTKRTVESTVREILKAADMEQATEHQIRSMASERLGIDLSLPDRKRFVRKVVENFLEQQCQQQEEEEAEAEEEEEEKDEARGRKKEAHKQQQQQLDEEFDDEGNLIICHLSNKRRVTVQEFRGKTLVSIREYYERDGRQLPSSKGISLTTDQWRSFKAAVPDIEAAIAQLK